MEDWFLRHMPLDDELLDLIERAFLDGQIDGLALDRAHIFLISLTRQSSAERPLYRSWSPVASRNLCGPFCGTQSNIADLFI